MLNKISTSVSYNAQLLFISILFSSVFFSDLSKKNTELNHELELILSSLNLYVNRLIEVSINLDIKPNHESGTRLTINLNEDNFFYPESAERLDQEHKDIIEKVFVTVKGQTNFTNFGVIFPDNGTVVSSVPYYNNEHQVAFSELCKAVRICTERYNEGDFFDNGIKFSQSYISNSKAVVTIYKPVKYNSRIFVYWIKYEIPSNSYFSNQFNYQLMDYDKEMGKSFYLRPKSEFDSLFSIKSKGSFERNGQIISYNTKIPVILTLDERDYVKFLGSLLIIIVLIYNFNLKKRNKKQLTFISKSALVDSLTGLYNRTFLEDFKSDIDKHAHYALISIDGNGIKSFNDNYGHKVGDDAIKAIAVALKNTFRSDDFIFRLGGDEFIVVVIGNYCKSTIDTFIERLNKSLSVSEVLKDKTVSVACGVSFSGETNDFDTLLKLSDSRMYKNKK